MLGGIERRRASDEEGRLRDAGSHSTVDEGLEEVEESLVLPICTRNEGLAVIPRKEGVKGEAGLPVAV